MALVRTKKGERVIPMLNGTEARLSTSTPVEIPDHYAFDLCNQDDNLEIVDPVAEAAAAARGHKSGKGEPAKG